MSTVDKHAAGTVGWFDLMTSDAEAARRFYAELFGWTYQVGPAETGFYAMAQLGGRHAAGVGAIQPGNPMPPAWSIYFITDDVDRTFARARELGAQAVMEPMDVMEEGRMAIAMDPTGAVFGLWQGKRHHGAQVVDEPGAMTWCEVNTRDGARAAEFYGQLFELEPRRLDASEMDYRLLQRGEAPITGVLQMDAKWPADAPPHWMPYFAVTSTDAACARAAELGGAVRVPALDTPYGRIAVIADPQGAVFSVVQPPPPPGA